MLKAIFHLSLAIMALSATLTPCCSAQPNEPAVKGISALQVSATKISDQEISFAVKNAGNGSVKVVRDYMPWNTVSALRLIAIPYESGGTVVEGLRPIEDPGAAVLEIAAAAQLKGTLKVASFFPQWGALCRRGVLLVWTLSLYDIETGKDRLFSGVVNFDPPKQKSG